MSQIMKEHGYSSIFNFLAGSVDKRDFVSWEGMNNLSYSNMTRKVFNQIDRWADVQIKAGPLKNWKKNEQYFVAYDGGFCRKIDVVTRNISESEIFWVRITMASEDSQILITFQQISVLQI